MEPVQWTAKATNGFPYWTQLYGRRKLDQGDCEDSRGCGTPPPASAHPPTRIRFDSKPKDPPAYHGKATEDMEVWSQQVDNYLQLLGGDDDMQVAYVGTLLQGAAQLWFQRRDVPLAKNPSMGTAQERLFLVLKVVLHAVVVISEVLRLSTKSRCSRCCRTHLYSSVRIMQADVPGRDVPQRQRVSTATAVLTEREWLLHPFRSTGSHCSCR